LPATAQNPPRTGPVAVSRARPARPPGPWPQVREAVGPKLGDSNARGFFKQVLTELEGAVERAGETYGEKKPAEAANREAPTEPDQ
jgi:hypothetical protein